MRARLVVLTVLCLVVLLAGVAIRPLAGSPSSFIGVPLAGASTAGTGPPAGLPASAQAAAQTDPLIISYPAKFTCLEPLQAGQIFFGVAAPLVRETTTVELHNPQSYPVTAYAQAVRGRVPAGTEIVPGAWSTVTIKAGQAVRLDCDGVARLLTGNPAATFYGTYGIGVLLEGYLVVGIGPQTVVGNLKPQPGVLNVTATYRRGSEFVKKDISYQPWWTWWWWALPWRLGYAYERILPIDSTAFNLDCRGLVYTALVADANVQVLDAAERAQTVAALTAGWGMEASTVMNMSAASPPALVVLIGGCDKLVTAQGSYLADVDYVIVSNKSWSDADPIHGGGVSPQYPWIPGRMYNLPVAMPQNASSDMDAFLRNWHIQRWLDAGGAGGNVNAAMVYFFPYWCGWGYWWGWWNGGSCLSAGVAAAESVDVEQVVGTRVLLPVWPPY
jgi:hypothetical protein